MSAADKLGVKGARRAYRATSSDRYGDQRLAGSPSVHERAAADGTDLRAAREEPCDLDTFGLSEMRLRPRSLKNLCNRAAVILFDQSVGVDKVQTQTLGKRTPDLRLAGSHEADKHDRARLPLFDPDLAIDPCCHPLMRLAAKGPRH